MTLSPLSSLILNALALISPVLTALHLWQIKEWRYDRMKEHLLQRGWTSACGVMRPAIVGSVLLLWLFLITIDLPVQANDALLVSLGLLASTSILQIIFGKQPTPVWTKKAMILCVLSMVLGGGIMKLLNTFIVQEEWQYIGIISIPILSFLIVGCALLLFLPIDTICKKRILENARSVREKHPHLTVIGITGSVGKTTTKELLAHLLQERGALATPEHVNTELGVAQWFHTTIGKEPEDSRKIVIVEMGAYRIGEIALLCDIVKPSIGILTYIGTQHVGLFGSTEKLRQAKMELIASLPVNGLAIVNGDSKRIQEIAHTIHCQTIIIGTDEHAGVQAIDIEETGNGTFFSVNTTRLHLPLAGTQMITNALLASVAAEKLGVSQMHIQEQLRTFQGFDRTFAQKEKNGVTMLDNTFSASVESTMSALEWARKKVASPKVLLFTGILELGDDEERLHHAIAEEANRSVDQIILLDPHFLRYFEEKAKEKTTLLSTCTRPLPSGALLICMGRMSQCIIESFLPPSSY